MANKIQIGGEFLTPLEVRLEISKRISNLRFELLKRVYDGRAIVEGYEKGEVECHVHGTQQGRIGNSKRNDRPLDSLWGKEFCGVFSARCRDGAVMGLHGEMPMLVWIRDGSEEARPVDSIIRLQPLDA